MSDVKSILSEEAGNRYVIHLHKEGLFYVAYERSCYAFHCYIKPFKLTKRFVKSAGQEVVKLGFPVSSMEKLMEGRKYEVTSGKLIAVFLNDDEPINEQDFTDWKNAVPCADNSLDTLSRPRLLKEYPEQQNNLISMILSFPLENRTPMDCMAFVAELKKTAMSLQHN